MNMKRTICPNRTEAVSPELPTPMRVFQSPSPRAPFDTTIPAENSPTERREANPR